MKTKLTLILSLFIFQIAYSQCPDPTALSFQSGNNINAMITNGGDLFWDGNDAQFNAPYIPGIEVNSIFAAGLWMGGLDLGGNLKLAAPTYGRANGSFDYIAGPINDDGSVNEDNCVNFDKIWTVTGEEILYHKADFQDNGIIDDPINAIFGWPAIGNPEFESINGFALPNLAGGFAAFFDENQNGIYEPTAGDYPIVASVDFNATPTMINWTIFNDRTLHSQSGGNEINAEVQLTTWSFNCTEYEVLNNTIFTSHKVTNKALEPIDSFNIGFWVDFDLGCYTDDYIGSAPNKNLFYAYNADGIDGNTSANDCFGINTYANSPPAQSVQFLNQSLDYFTYYNNGGISPPPTPGTTDPDQAQDYFKYLTGSWKDGTLLTGGGTGYNPSGPAVNHAFPGNPNNPNEWSMSQENLPGGDFRGIGSYIVELLNPGQSTTLDMAFTFTQDGDFDHLEIVDQMLLNADLIQTIYDNQFSDACAIISDAGEILSQNINISPNPSTGIFHLNLGSETISDLQLFDLSGKLLWADESQQTNELTLDFSSLPSGLYLLNISSDEISYTERLVIF